MDESYFKFKLIDLPIHEFSVLLYPNKQKELIENASDVFGDWGSCTKLSKHLKTVCKSLENATVKSVNDNYISSWKSGKKFIPIDVIIELCKLRNIEPELIKDFIIKFKDNTGKDRNAINFNFSYDVALASLSELIKAEGHIKRNLNQLSFVNESVDLINHFKELLKGFDVNKNLDEDSVVEVAVPENEKIIEVLRGDKNLNYWTKINKSGKLKLVFIDNFIYGTEKFYKIITEKRAIEVEVYLPFESKIITKSTYGVAGAAIHSTVTNITLCKVLHMLCGVPTGKKSKIIRICPLSKR